MSCPACGCKVSYQFDGGSDDGLDDDRLERCAACGNVFEIEDGEPDPEDDS